MTQTKTLIRFRTIALLCSGWLGATFAITAQPEARELKGAITFDHAVEVPGVVLPAGTYVIRVKGPAPDNTPPGSNLVEFLSKDESRIYATVRSIRDYRPSPAGKPLFTFYEDADGQQLALKAWWPPANPQPYQERFIYPTARALELMRAMSDAALHPHPKPRGSGKPSEVLPAVTSGRSRTIPARTPTDMPKTASDMPLLLLTGLLWCLAGFALRAFSILAAQKATFCTAGAIPPEAQERSAYPFVRQALMSLASGAPFRLRIAYRRTQPK